MAKKGIKKTSSKIKKEKHIVEVRIKTPNIKKVKAPKVIVPLKPAPIKTIPVKEDNVAKKINENLVSLQKIELGLIDKFDNLTKQISSLLVIFESAAKTMAKGPEAKDSELAKKVDKLLQQNKAIIETIEVIGEGQAQPSPQAQPAQPQTKPTQPQAYQPQSPPPAQPEKPAPEEKARPPASGRALPRF